MGDSLGCRLVAAAEVKPRYERGFRVPKFLVTASYTSEGTKGLVQGGASQRRKAVEDLLASLGGKLECFYFTLGNEDAILIVDLPSTEEALAVAMAVRASGMVQSTMTALLPIEEADRAIARRVEYRPPGR